MKGKPFGAIQKISNKVASAEKKWGQGGILSVLSRFWACFVFFSFRFGCGLRFECFEIVEQMNKKGDFTRLKKLPTVRVGHIFY